jgi:hypothetical protein
MNSDAADVQVGLISFDFELSWRRLFQKRIVRTEFDIYVFISRISLAIVYDMTFTLFVTR